MTQELQLPQTLFLDKIKKNAGVAITVGVVVMLIGILVAAAPMVAGISVALMVGVMLVIGGIAQLVFAIKTGSGIFPMVIAILTVIAGGYMVSNLDIALAALTFFLAIYLFISGHIRNPDVITGPASRGVGMGSVQRHPFAPAGCHDLGPGTVKLLVEMVCIFQY